MIVNVGAYSSVNKQNVLNTELELNEQCSCIDKNILLFIDTDHPVYVLD